MGTIDLTKLEDYIVIPLMGDDVSKVKDLRELDQVFGDGVAALWSDEKQSILAFAFNKVLWDDEDAKAWVKAAKTGDVQAAAESENGMPYKSMKEVNPSLKGIEPPVTLAQANIIASWADAIEKGENPPDAPWAVAIANFKKAYEVKNGKWVKREAKSAVAAMSFDEIRSLVGKALDAHFNINPNGMLPDGTANSNFGPWIYEMGLQKAVYEYAGKNYAIPYTIDGTQVTFGDPEPVIRGWLDGKDASVILLAYDSVLADTDEGDDDGLVWKEIIKPGAWFKMDSGRKINVTADIIEETYRAFVAGLPKLISVPADSHHGETRGVVPAEANRGFVSKLKMIGDALFGGFKFTDPQVEAGVEDGSIADCSVYLQPDVFHPETGEKFPWVLRHVLLTNNPLVQSLGRFGDIPADGDGGGVTVIHYRQAPEKRQTTPRKEAKMPQEKVKDAVVLDGADEIVLTGDAAREYSALAGLGFTADELKALAAQRDAITVQAAELCKKARDMEIVHIVKALEGGDEHAGVVQIAGYRHYPAVIVAVEKVLREAPTALALNADGDGVSLLDTTVFGILNALPAEARIKVGDERTLDKQGPKGLSASGDVTDEQIDDLLEKIE